MAALRLYRAFVPKITPWLVLLPALLSGFAVKGVEQLICACVVSLCLEVAAQHLSDGDSKSKNPKVDATKLSVVHTSSEAGAGVARPLEPCWDADVIVVGAGVAGASLATTLARNGNRVQLIERRLEIVEPGIIGELLQPGGIRALERLGLSHTTTDAFVDSVEVKGYVCIAPYTPASSDIILSYPEVDPRTLPEYVGLASGSPCSAKSPPPRGRSFHNSRFVHQLRRCALAEPLVSIYSGRVTRLVCASDLEASMRSADPSPPVKFAGYDASGRPLPTQAAPADTNSVNTNSCTPQQRAAGGSVTGSGGGGSSRVVGVSWIDEQGKERVSRAPLTVVCDGRYSILRGSLSSAQPKTMSFMAGLLLRHSPDAGPNGILPYARRGHVILANPGIVLLYQISAMETRALVDIPGPLPNVEDGSLQRYLLEIVAPQLPPGVRPLFVEAVRTQEPVCMPTKYLPTAGEASPAPMAGAILLGDSWNMRHPITGGGMTVALRDAESLAALLHAKRGAEKVPVSRLSDAEVEQCISAFRQARRAHAGTVNLLANALHMVFSVPLDIKPGTSLFETRETIRAACLEYFGMGGACTKGPVGLLAGLTPSPAILIYHFYFVALVAVFRTLKSRPLLAGLGQSAAVLSTACGMIMPLLRHEGVTVLAWPLVQRALRVAIPWTE